MASPAVEVRRSARRKRMVSARREGDRMVVFIPGWMSDEQERDWVAKMVQRMEASEARRRSPGRTGDEALLTRAQELSSRWLEGRTDPASVRWVPTMRTRWASCTPVDRTIRISERLRDAPGWVVDYVLVHELAHLLSAAHDDVFWSWVYRYPRTERAIGYLEGLNAAASLGITGVDGDPPTAEQDAELPDDRIAATGS
ncbi:M48 metallopeptidase family protein [Pseudonocardia sp. HH130630-07]|uniref:M48 metallopeptidase family protein n=1 Tax=Pseudonocardia sp. HH130630-07 TaxID=1690815 RepID=UPI000814F178|nr:YgjP-like metallopeptidase domain-containing protein [Pseudonocardia sp. HH130630-07]ANY05888.1 metal-dependent hydrolase [Pseudonocardia sp. HH130630-07]